MVFQVFSSLHLVIILSAVGLIVFTRWYAKRAFPEHYQRDSHVFTVLMFGIYILLTVTKLIQKEWTVQGNLPLHLCDISAWTLVYALYRRNNIAFEAGYYWGFTGALLAFLVPTVTKVDWYLIPFFVWHALLAAMPIYYMYANKAYPTMNGLWRTVRLTIGLGVFIKCINHFIGYLSGKASNYMFLNEKIDSMSQLGLPDYPFYLLYMIPIMVFVFLVFLFLGYKRQ